MNTFTPHKENPTMPDNNPFNLSEQDQHALKAMIALQRGGAVLDPEVAQAMRSALLPDLTPEKAMAEFGPPGPRMYFPQTIRITLSARDRRHIRFERGFHNVPAKFASHPYLVASGAREVTAVEEKAMLKAEKEEDNQTFPAGWRMQPVR